jgi:hypothetical protein
MLAWPPNTIESAQAADHRCQAPKLSVPTHYAPCAAPATALVTNVNMGKLRMCWDCAGTWARMRGFEMLKVPYVDPTFYEAASLSKETGSPYPQATAEICYGCYWGRDKDGNKAPARIWRERDGRWAAVIGLYKPEEQAAAVIRNQGEIARLWAFSSGEVIPRGEYSAMREAFETAGLAAANREVTKEDNKPPEEIPPTCYLTILDPANAFDPETKKIADRILELRDQLRPYRDKNKKLIVNADNVVSITNTYSGLGEQIGLMKPRHAVEKAPWLAGSRFVDDKFRTYLGDAEEDKNEAYRTLTAYQNELKRQERERVAAENKRIAEENVTKLREAEERRQAELKAAAEAGTAPPPPSAGPELMPMVELEKVLLKPTTGGRALSARKKMVIKSYNYEKVVALLKSHRLMIDALEGELDEKTGERKGGILKKLLSAEYPGLGDLVETEMM